MSEKITKFIEGIKSLSVLELNELVEAIQEEFGVSAVVATSNVGSTDNTATAKTEFDVVLTSYGDAKMAVIKLAKEVLGLGLKEAKEVVESVPKTIKESISESEANELKSKFEEVGASVEIK
jgi:large subunit ribosomal protein L7/L12